MCEANAELPFYQRQATPEQQAETLLHVQRQIEHIKDQERIEVPSQHLKVRCGCLKLVRWMYAYRCLYCGVWFCKQCAEEHFGYRVPGWDVPAQQAEA